MPRHVPTLDDDFIDNRVIVTLKQEYSDVNKAIDEDLFRNALSDRSMIKSIEDLTYITNPSIITDRASFVQILSIYLRDNSKENVLSVIYKLEKLYSVLAAEPAYNYIAIDLWTPNDPMFNNQWGLRGTYGIQAQQAWDITKGDTNPRIKVGLFEAGLEATHHDLRVIPGNIASDGSTHGTRVGGIIGAINNNNIGIAGIAQVELALLNRSSGSFAGSLTWAINNNIKIINASFSYEQHGQPAPANIAHENAIRNFGNSGGLLIAAAGNDSNDTDVAPEFPAGYGDARYFPTINNVISVGSINENGTRSSFSNYGLNSVHIYAPGDNILTTTNLNGFIYTNGTSFAAPHVAGVAALLLSTNPNLTGSQMRNIILNNSNAFTVNTPSGNQPARRLNANDAVKGSLTISSNTTWNNTFTLDRLYVIDGVDLTLNNMTINPNTNSTNNANSGFEIKNGGRLILNHSTINLGNAKITVTNTNSRVISNATTQSSGHGIYVNGGKFILQNGGHAYFTDSNLSILLNTGSIDLKWIFPFNFDKIKFAFKQ